MTQRDELTLLVNGTAYSGWQDVRVTRGVERCPSDFEVRLTEKHPGGRLAPLKPGDPVEVRMGADPLLVGYIDRLADRISAEDHALAVTGRGRCQDIVDCSAEIAAWNGQRLEAEFLPLVQELCAPYGIPVTDLSGGGANQKFETFTAMLGESAFEIIERVARSLGLLVFEGAEGDLVLARVAGGDQGEVRDGLALGANVQSATVVYAADQRYNSYEVVAHPIDSFADGAQAMNLPSWNTRATATDPGVRRKRNLILVGEQWQRGESLAQKRATWEMNRRWGRGQTLKVLCDSWRDTRGRPWEPNTLVSLDLPALYLAGKAWLVADVTYRRGLGSGTVAELSLMPKEAFAIQPTTLAPLDWDRQQALNEAARVAALPPGVQDPQQ